MTRRVMVANRGRDTKPELLLRRRVHAMGLRYRVGLTVRVAGVRVRPDLTFTRVRVAVFVDGCFWHRCPQHGCEPQTNVDYWVPKLEGNVVRDRRVDAALRAAGWTVVRVWEHEDVGAAADRVRRAVCRRTRT
jgi:DNA mismatch endonuclease (patch repair protein)